MRILLVGDMNQRTSAFKYCQALKDLGHVVRSLSDVPRGRIPGVSAKPSLWTRFRAKVGYPRDETGVNERLPGAVERFDPDLVWLQKAITVRPATLERVTAESDATIVFSSGDNVEKPHNRTDYFPECIQYFDVAVMARGYDESFYLSNGADRVLEFDLGYNRHSFFPRAPGRPYTYDVTFVGSYEAQRHDYIAALADGGIDVHVWGNAWDDVDSTETLHAQHRPVYGEEYVATMHDSKVVLNFYRQLNDDVMNSRVFEIPASGSFMLSERTDPEFRFFEAGTEAAYFDSPEELVEKAQMYLDRPDEREAIARRGRERCVESGYDYHSRLEEILAEL